MLGRLLDFIIALGLFVSIPITVLIDSQLFCPKEWYPKELVDMVAAYAKDFRDPLTLHHPDWFKSFVLCEIFLQLPFAIIGTYAFLRARRWIRTPALLFGSHLSTCLSAILYHLAVHDFSKYEPRGPITTEERLKTASVFIPYFFLGILIILRVWFGNAYAPVVRRAGKQKTN